MNIENLKALSAHLTQLKDEYFNMEGYAQYADKEFRTVYTPDLLKAIIKTGNHCGTVCCIAGEAAILQGVPITTVAAHQQAAEFLDLDFDQANWLFMGDFSPAIKLTDVPKEHAIMAVDYLIEHQGLPAFDREGHQYLPELINGVS